VKAAAVDAALRNCLRDKRHSPDRGLSLFFILSFAPGMFRYEPVVILPAQTERVKGEAEKRLTGRADADRKGLSFEVSHRFQARMRMKVSKFGSKGGGVSGIGHLMRDLGDALSGGDMLMLGGGNPAHIPEVEEALRGQMERLIGAKGRFSRMMGDYEPAQGSREFIAAVCDLLGREYGWEVRPDNVALTNGSQWAFFMLFNMFAGQYEDGSRKKILFPVAPEYIGYSDVGLEDDLFTAQRPEIEHIDEHIFKYHVDFDAIDVTADVGAICVSRPTNPTANILTDGEVQKLSSIARRHDIPLIIDSAYGLPFPGIVFTDVRPHWDEHTILCMSLSKLGMPGTRTGIVIARPEVIEMVTEFNAVMSLSPGGIGAAVATELVGSGEILQLSREVIRPFYQRKAEAAMELLLEGLDGISFHIHRPEGAFFLWLWLDEMTISDAELYERLKKRGVVVVPGHYFFPGLAEEWEHRHQCIRISYAQDSDTVERGLKIIAEEVKAACDDT
jgi:valine--pyruvate aminotransferase